MIGGNVKTSKAGSRPHTFWADLSQIQPSWEEKSGPVLTDPVSNSSDYLIISSMFNVEGKIWVNMSVLFVWDQTSQWEEHPKAADGVANSLKFA